MIVIEAGIRIELGLGTGADLTREDIVLETMQKIRPEQPSLLDLEIHCASREEVV